MVSYRNTLGLVLDHCGYSAFRAADLGVFLYGKELVGLIIQDSKRRTSWSPDVLASIGCLDTTG
jgi:hypothetical protein